MEVQGALSTLARSPGDQNAMGALSAYAPETAWKMQDRQRETQKRGILSRVFAPPSAASAQPALSPYATPQPSVAGALSTMTSPSPSLGVTPGDTLPSAGSASAAPGGAPATLLQPQTLPPRTDGLRVNPEAMAELYAADPASAFEIQTHIFNADKHAAERLRDRGLMLGTAAHRLGTIRAADGGEDIEGRRRELAGMAPLLSEMGITPEQMQRLDLSDVGLARHTTVYRSLADVIKDERADRRLSWDREDDEADNDRADRNIDSTIEDRNERRGLVARGQNIASGDRQRGQDLTDSRGRFGIGVASADRQRGQDLSHTDRVRGQDLGDSRGRRGQDLVEKRARDGVGRRGRRSGSTTDAPPVGTVRNGFRFKGGNPGDRNAWESVGGAAPQGAGGFR
jgi:hypothetical protein